MNIFRTLDEMINRITMYKLVAYGLTLLAGISLLFSITNTLDYPTTALLKSLLASVVVCYVVNTILSKAWQVPANSESWLITALILFFILPPATSTERLVVVIVAAAVAMLVKYLLVYRRAHLVNPAAFGAVAVSLSGLGFASWWVGTPVMLPLVGLLGILIVRKLRRYSLVICYVAISVITVGLVAYLREGDVTQAITDASASGPLVFLGAIMLTEPSTMPALRHQQLIYGGLVAVLATSQWKLGGLHATPELALIIGNIYSLVVSPKQKWRLQLKEIRQLSPRVYDLSFVPDRPLQFLPGQYMEWTLAHEKADIRGNRRTFSIASAPTETEVHLGIKTYQPSSSYKKAMLTMKPGQTILAGQVNGNFVLPRNLSEKLVFLAGGIGITPFRSMLQQLIITQQPRDIVLFYFVSSPDEVSYQDVLNEAKQKIGLKYVPILSAKDIPKSWKGYTGTLNADILQAEAPDYASRTFYLSGPAMMVDAHKRNLRSLGVNRRNIHSDHFSGY